MACFAILSQLASPETRLCMDRENQTCRRFLRLTWQCSSVKSTRNHVVAAAFMAVLGRCPVYPGGLPPRSVLGYNVVADWVM